MTTTTIGTGRTGLVTGLRALADYLAEHPEVPINFEEARITYTVLDEDDQSGLTNLAAIADLLGTTITGYDGEPVDTTTTHFHAARRFGPVTYRAAYISRAEVADYVALMSYRDSIRADRPAATA